MNLMQFKAVIKDLPEDAHTINVRLKSGHLIYDVAWTMPDQYNTMTLTRPQEGFPPLFIDVGEIATIQECVEDRTKAL